MITSDGHTLFRDLVQRADRYVLTTHLNPDGDAIGSQFGLAGFLRERGKQVRIVNQDPTPEILRFIETDAATVEVYDPARHDSVLEETDLVVLVDNSAPDRLGDMERVMLAVAGQTLCIDHHPSREPPWAHKVLDQSACATSAMIFELTRTQGYTPDRPAAEALYVGLATDTGFFRFNSTNAQSHEVAAQLIKLGVQPSRAYQAIYERNSVAFTRVLGHALVGLRVDAGGAVASVTISREMLRTLDAIDVDTSEVTTPLLAMDGVYVALLFRELPDGRIKVSLRSKGDLDLHKLASEFGGGGHRNASGIVMSGEMESVVRQITERTSSLLGGKP